MRLTLADGRVFEREEPINRGNPENPMPQEEVEEKFRRNAARALPPEKVEAAARAALALDDAPDLGDLMAACRP